jgi:hypothetical protein
VASTRQRLETLEGALEKALLEVRGLKDAIQGEDPTKQMIARWCDAWRKRHGAVYQVTKADAGNIKRLTGILGAAELTVRLGRFINDRDVWLTRQRHPLAVFYSRVNLYATQAAGHVSEEDAPAAAVGCKHTPACTSDAQHTALKLAEVYDGH